MSRNTLTLVQEVYFDFCDLLDHNELASKIDGFYEYEELREFIQEQKTKLAMIEKDLDFAEVS